MSKNMTQEDFKQKVEIAQAAVKNLDESLRTTAFKIILEKLLATETPQTQKEPRRPVEQRQPREKMATPTQVSPIPIDLKGNKDIPALRKFYKEKAPSTNQQKVTLFVYYINTFLKIKDALPGHIISCYNEVRERKPLQIVQLFRDTKHRKGWLDNGEEKNSATITISGENLVEHDLPSGETKAES